MRLPSYYVLQFEAAAVGKVQSAWVDKAHRMGRVLSNPQTPLWLYNWLFSGLEIPGYPKLKAVRESLDHLKTTIYYIFSQVDTVPIQ
jgi:hypothetical protein